jgi:2',3'-cyclic-nucleotide 2'-phosphodiesterase (5'-nucleotidase family)
VSGIRYVFDNGSPKMQRVTQLTLDNGRTLDEARVYSVAVNNFMATGGDDYRVFRNAKSSTETGVLVRDAMERLVMKLESGGKTLDYGADGRITAAR